MSENSENSEKNHHNSNKIYKRRPALMYRLTETFNSSKSISTYSV